MINTLITKALENRYITILVFVVITVVGCIAINQTPVDAIPDLSENQVIVMTQWPGQTPKNIEDQVTYPITVSMQGLAGVKDVRAMSQMGISMVTVIFKDNIDIYFARDRVSERLSLVQAKLPPQVKPMLGPDATGLGQIFMYTVENDDKSLTELRSLQDFTISYALASVDGVAEVASVGGYVKKYQVELDPIKLDQYNIHISDVISILKTSNNNVSGNVINSGNKEIAIQGIGFFENIDDIANIVINTKSNHQALTIGDIAKVRISGAPRRSILANQDEEKVGGIIVMRYGENPLEVIKRVQEKITQIQHTLPEGTSIEPFYDRTTLIMRAIDTLTSVLSSELVITAIILGLFLWHLGATVITAISLLIGVLITFIMMYLFSIPSNIMSLGGIAIAVGTMVDASIVTVENIYNKLATQTNKNEAIISKKKHIGIITQATLEVSTPIIFAIFIIILSFVPIFSLEGMEGKLFRPLAFTNTFAMLGALITALFLAPPLATWFMKGNFKRDNQIPIVIKLQKLYKPLLLKALHCRKQVYITTAILITTGGLLLTQIGSEFMPPLNEGSIMYMPMTVPNVSEKRAAELLIATNQIIADFPEVERVVGKAGRANTATDPAPLAMFETFITLKPESQWRSGMSKEKLIKEMNTAIKIDNLWNGFTQPIIGRIDMLSTGIRAQVGLKIFGNDHQTLENLAIQSEDLLGYVPGAYGVAAIRTSGLQYMDIDLDEAKLAQYGIPKSKAISMISAGVGGSTITTTIEGREKYGIEVRLKQAYRQDIEDIKSIPLRGQGGQQVLMKNIANISLVDGPSTINSENGMMRSAVQMNVQGIDLGSFVKNAQEYIKENLELPEGYYVEWSGQYENQIRAKQRLMWIVPSVIAVIFFILFIAYKDIGLVSIVMLSIPLSLVGGVIALFIARYNMSVAVWVGFIALFGNAVETGVVIVMYLENAFREKFHIPLEGTLHTHAYTHITREGIYEAVVEGAMLRLRPIMMTALTSIIGLFPMLIATGTGAEIQKPLALVVVSGLTTSVFLTLIVIPVLFTHLRERMVK